MCSEKEDYPGEQRTKEKSVLIQVLKVFITMGHLQGEERLLQAKPP